MLGCGQQTKSAGVPTEDNKAIEQDKKLLASDVSSRPREERNDSENTAGNGDTAFNKSGGVVSYLHRGMSWTIAHWKPIAITISAIAAAVILGVCDYKYDLHGKAWEKTKKGMKWTWEMVKLPFEKDRKLFAKKADLGSDKSNSDSDKQKKKLNKEQNVHRNSSSNKGERMKRAISFVLALTLLVGCGKNVVSKPLTDAEQKEEGVQPADETHDKVLDKADESLAMLKAKRKNLKAYTELINAQILQARLNKWTAGKWATAVISLAWLAVAGVLAFACKDEIFTRDMGSNGGIEKLFFILSAATGTVAGAACFI